MSQSNPRTNEPKAAVVAGMSVEARKKKLATLAATNETLNELAKEFLRSVDPESDIAMYILSLDNLKTITLAKIIQYHKGLTKLAIKHKAMVENGTNAMGRVKSAINAGLFQVDENGRVLSITKENYPIYLDIRNQVDRTNYTITSHNTLLRIAGFLMDHNAGGSIQTGVYAWTYKDKSQDLSDPSFWQISVHKNGHRGHVVEPKGKGQGKYSGISKEEFRKVAAHLRDKQDFKMSNITDEEADEICPGRTKDSVLAICNKFFGSVVPSKASKHPNFALALEGKLTSERKKKKVKAKAPTSTTEDSKLPAASTKAKKKVKAKAPTATTEDSKLPAASTKAKGKAASDGKENRPNKRIKMAVLDDESESELEFQVVPKKSRRSSKQPDLKFMGKKEAEDEKEDYVPPSDPESDDDEY